MQVETEVLSFEAIRALYPDLWVLIGGLPPLTSAPASPPPAAPSQI